ncbi:MAG: helix-hairpin-helix domain-containing protein [Alphaproteobacteria bacterium]|nr:helix-hairpin-helix domain-containing protein [Alphaproteobacteria bacterium]
MSRAGAALGALVLGAAMYVGAPLLLKPAPPPGPLVQWPEQGWAPPPERGAVFRHGDRVEQIEGSLRAAPPGSPLVFGQPLDLNLASAAQLQALPGLGPSLAARVVSSRDEEGPFLAVAELERVKGIGPATRARVEPWLVVSE